MAALLAASAACTPSADGVRMLDPPAGPGAGEPHLTMDARGRPVLSWVESDGATASLRYARLVAGRWSVPVTVARGEDWFVNWADFPSVTPIGDTLWAAHWLVRQPAGGYAYDVVVALSHDGGETWGKPLVPHEDGTPTEHGFVSLFPWQGEVGAVWLDGRQMAGPGAGHGDDGGAMTLRFARIGSGLVTQSSSIDGRACDCCQTDAALTGSGVLVVYRDRSEDEIRDIYAIRSSGTAWLPGVPVAADGWRIEGCPVNGPAVAADGDAAVVAWYTMAAGRPRVQAVFSTDGGASFGPPLEVSTEAPVGRVDVALLPDGSAVVSWMESLGNDRAAILLRRLTPTGSAGPPQRVAVISSGRQAGFPQLVTLRDALLVAWTDVADGATRVRAALLTTASLDE